MRPEFITFTGVDEDTDPVGLVQLADDYPVEFGLLLSPKRQGVEPRYPKMTTIEWLVEELPLRWAAHLCGADARSVIYDDCSQHDALLTLFHRVQVNTDDPQADPIRVARWAAGRNLRAVMQCRDGFPRVTSVDILFDASGGRGISPKGWPLATWTTFCGYAGGLNPANVADAVANIGAQDHLRYWIDMESGVRDERDRFSLEKCRAVCEAVYGPVGVAGKDDAQQDGNAFCPGHGVSYPWTQDCPECVKDAHARGMSIDRYYSEVRPRLRNAGVSESRHQTFPRQTPMPGKEEQP